MTTTSTSPIADLPEFEQTKKDDPTFSTAPPAPSSWNRPTPAHRASILQDLYDERSLLLQKRRLGKMAGADELLLGEITREIDRWERDEINEARSKNSVWTEIDELASRVLKLK